MKKKLKHNVIFLITTTILVNLISCSNMGMNTKKAESLSISSDSNNLTDEVRQSFNCISGDKLIVSAKGSEGTLDVTIRSANGKELFSEKNMIMSEATATVPTVHSVKIDKDGTYTVDVSCTAFKGSVQVIQG